jgi:DNA-binding NarL/FixJ family response regulator
VRDLAQRQPLFSAKVVTHGAQRAHGRESSAPERGGIALAVLEFMDLRVGYEQELAARLALDDRFPEQVSSQSSAMCLPSSTSRVAVTLYGERLRSLPPLGCGEHVAPELAVTLWQALFEGRWELLAYSDGPTQRLLLARRNRLARTSQPLSVRQQGAAKLALLGHSTKYLAFELGVALSTASTLVSSAIRKLGLRSRAELTELFGGLPPNSVSAYMFDADCDSYVLFETPPRRLEPPSCLTEAEREVVRGVLCKKSNAEIACARKTSVNTVANQLRAIYKKLGISGRSELISAC